MGTECVLDMTNQSWGLICFIFWILNLIVLTEQFNWRRSKIIPLILPLIILWNVEVPLGGTSEGIEERQALYYEEFIYPSEAWHIQHQDLIAEAFYKNMIVNRFVFSLE